MVSLKSPFVCKDWKPAGFFLNQKFSDLRSMTSNLPMGMPTSYLGLAKRRCGFLQSILKKECTIFMMGNFNWNGWGRIVFMLNYSRQMVRCPPLVSTFIKLGIRENLLSTSYPNWILSSLLRSRKHFLVRIKKLRI